MHVGVEEAVAEHLGEEDLDAGARERRDVDALLPQALRPGEIGVPCMRSITITRCAHKSQYTSGTSSSGEPSKLRRSWLALAASRIRSSSSSRWCANSATTSRGLRRRPSAHHRSTSCAAVSSSARSLAITASTPGRSTLTATSRAVVQLRRGGPARSRRSRPVASRTNSNTSSMLLPRDRSISPRASSAGNGGTWSCSFASSSAMSSGSRSRRVDSTWPNLTKIGPSVSSASRSRRPRVLDDGERSCSR